MSENEGDGIKKWLADITIQWKVEETDQQSMIHETDLTRVIYIYIYILD